MKLILSELVHLLTKKQERNVRILLKLSLYIFILVTIYSVLFHFLMLYEGRDFSWITGYYWTLTVMSTLGFGDITFHTDLGKLFSIIVLLSGVVLLLTVLPFTFIQFFYLPWVDAQAKARAPRELPEGTRDHIVLTSHDPVSMNLAEKLRQYQHDYVIVVEDAHKALELQDRNLKVAVGHLGNPRTYEQLKVDQAALVVANIDDMMNTNIAITVREVCDTVPIVANAEIEDSIDILELSGCSRVYQFTKILGESLARRVLGTSTKANVIGCIEDLLIAEAPAMRTSLVGKTLLQSNLRETVGVNVVGLWERGRFITPTADTVIHTTTVLLLAGTLDQLSTYDHKFGQGVCPLAPVLILGGGRVGQAAGQVLQERHIDYRIIEKDESVHGDPEHTIYGSAADIHTLTKAGIKEAPAVIITTHDDATNIYLSIYCRKLCPDIQIICRANLEQNISKLHTAGADLVMSYASMAADTVLNLLNPGELFMLAEGLNIFRVAVPSSFVGKTLAESQLSRETGLNLIGIHDQDTTHTNPGPDFEFSESNELILIGDMDAENRFFGLYSGMEKIRASEFKEGQSCQVN